MEADRFCNEKGTPVIPKQGFAHRHHDGISHDACLDVYSPPASYKKSTLWCSIGREQQVFVSVSQTGAPPRVMNQSKERREKIRDVCSPACASGNVLEKMMTAGMNVACIGTNYLVEQMKELVPIIRLAEESRSFSEGIPRYVSIAIETNGPVMLTGGIDGEASVKKGDTFKLTTDKAYYDKGDSGIVYIDYDNIQNILTSENRIFIMDGTIPLLITNFHGSNMICTVECDGVLRSWRPVFLPNIEYTIPPLTDVDLERIKCGIDLGIDIILAGKIRKAADILAIRNVIGETAPHLKIFARIECFQALNNFDEIIAIADGVLVNRTCLGVEVPLEKVFISQKNIISRCLRKGVAVIGASEFIPRALITSRPGSHESNDIANTIIDGADGVVIEATMNGKYPVQCVQAMTNSCIEAEAAIDDFKRCRLLLTKIPCTDVLDTLAASGVQAAYLLRAAAIVTVVDNSSLVNKLSMFKPTVPILAVTCSTIHARRIAYVRCIMPVIYTSINDGYIAEENWPKFINSRLEYAIKFGKINGIILSGDPIIVLLGEQPLASYSNCMRIIYVSDVVEPISY